MDEQDVLNAIAHVDTQSLEQEAQVLETVEAIGLSSSSTEEVLDDTFPEYAAPAGTDEPPSAALSGEPGTVPPNPTAPNPVIQRGFY